MSATAFAPGGTRTYVANLANALVESSVATDCQLSFSQLPAWLQPRGKKGAAHKLRVLLWESYYVHGLLPNRSRAADLLHAPALRLPLIRPRPVIVTVLDVIPLIFPELFRRHDEAVFHLYSRLAARHADHIITISAQSRRDIHSYLGIPLDRITVTPIGVGAQYRPIPVEQAKSVLAHYGVEQPYILAVGTLEPRKNLLSTLKMYRDLKTRHGMPHHLVVVGGSGWRQEPVARSAAGLHIEDTVHITGFVPNEHLPALYSAADVLVYPSLYEGFGLPVLEAMACGCPVVASDRSAIPEVVGSAGLLVDPLNITAIGEAVSHVLTDPALREMLIAKGLDRAAAFTWQNCAEQTLQVYQRLRNGYG